MTDFTSRRNEDLDKVLNEANDYYSLAGGVGTSASAANGLSAISGSGGDPTQTISLNSVGAIDSRNFDVTNYTAELLQNATIKGLYEQDTKLRQDIRSLDGFLQDLVYKNYSKFINATDTIKRMRDNVVDIDSKLQALSTNVDDITTVNQTISGNLEGHRTKIQEMLVRNATLQKIKFLVDLPASMERSYREGRYSDVVSEWVKGDALLTSVLKRHTNVQSFTRTQTECRKTAKKVFDKLTGIIRSGGGVPPPDAADNHHMSGTGDDHHNNHQLDGSMSGSKQKRLHLASPTSPMTSTTNAVANANESTTAAGGAQSAASPALDPDDAAYLIRLAYADLKRLVPTSIFDDTNRPKDIEAEVIAMQMEQTEAALKANIDVAVTTIVNDMHEAVAFDGSVSRGGAVGSSSTSSLGVSYEAAGRKLATVGTEMLQQSLKFSLSKYISSIQGMQTLMTDDVNDGSRSSAAIATPIDTLNARVEATIKATLIRVIDVLYPALKTSSGALLRFIVLNQHRVTDSHRDASDVSRIVQGVCEEAFEAITALLNSFSRGLKQLSSRFLTTNALGGSAAGSNSNNSSSANAAIGVMIDDAANTVLQYCLGTLGKFSEGADFFQQQQNNTSTTTSSPKNNNNTNSGPARIVNGKRNESFEWIVAHYPLVAALLAKKFVLYQVEGFGIASTSSSSALQASFASATKKLVAHFITLAGQHFASLFQRVYLTKADNADISSPHDSFQLMFRQWMALHSECLAWFPDGQGKMSTRASAYSGGRHERSDSMGSASSSQQSGRPSLAAMSAAAAARAGSGMAVIPSVANFTKIIGGGSDPNAGSSRFGGGNRRLAIIPTTIDARHIQEAVILHALLSLEDLVRIVHFSRPAFQQLQVDLSFILQQTAPNASYWLRDDALFVNIVNDIASSAFARTIGDKAPLSQGMVEKLARTDD